MSRTWPTILVAAGITLATAVPAASAASPASTGVPQVRVNQVGYPAGGQFAPFNTTTAGYEDNVVSWPSVEPADDYAATSLFAFALGGAGLG